ncbi:MOSC domain-containing protein [Roseibium sp. MMSF_3412]|uniref:MOSC domain-containing protein n=1 Tax=Roseibium sp. MMSF_3412 TaxID=3046712 RepID=UPI00273D24BC|nr:MOSC domain-containing protein [Roseibium sp. MMSF_3412]
MTEIPVTISRLNRFPVKGMSAELLGAVTLSKGEGIPGDRLYGFARYDSGFDPKNPEPLPKERFVVLVKEAALAGLKTRFSPVGQTLEIDVNGKAHTFDMSVADGRSEAARFLHEVLKLGDPEPPVFVSSAPHRFTDVSVVSPQMMNAISVLNLASVKALGDRLGTEVHPGRFRANIEIDGLPPFSELDAVGQVLKFGDVRLRILSRTRRCAATEVNPVTAERDLKVPYLLRKELGHMDMGVYVEVEAGGQIRAGQDGKLDPHVDKGLF